MNLKFLRNSNLNSRLLIIFGGWDSTPAVYEALLSHLPSSWDLLLVYDYDSEAFPDETISHYRTIYLMAWSLGVAAAERLLKNIEVARAIAINGTSFPCHDEFGIPQKIYEGTRSMLSPRQLAKFRRRMFDSKDQFCAATPLMNDHPVIDALKAQLDFIRQLQLLPSDPKFWDRAYISLEDGIIPSDNQLRYWKECLPDSSIHILKGPHFPDLTGILRDCIPNTESVGRNFRIALSTYTNQADAQRDIASALADMIDNNHTPDNSTTTLEIGARSGLFTHLWSKKIHPASAYFCDLYPLPEFKVAPVEQYIVGDGESFISKTDIKFDFIFCANAMQWFADPLRFIKDAFSRLKPGGALYLSTFLPGNLAELDALRPCPLFYIHQNRIAAIAANLSETNTTREITITKEFDNVRNLLLHLRHTGVSSAGASRLSIKAISDILRQEDSKYRLTYKGLLISIKKST